jgi:hypothetical protein
MDTIILELAEDHFPQLLKRYSPEKIKEMAIDMALKQYKDRPVTKAMLHSCLANLESDLATTFPYGQGEK